MKNAGIGIAVFAVVDLLADNAALANNILNPDPEVQGDLEAFMNRYSDVLEKAAKEGYARDNDVYLLELAGTKYFKRARYNDSFISAWETVFKFLQR